MHIIIYTSRMFFNFWFVSLSRRCAVFCRCGHVAGGGGFESRFLRAQCGHGDQKLFARINCPSGCPDKRALCYGKRAMYSSHIFTLSRESYFVSNSQQFILLSQCVLLGVMQCVGVCAVVCVVLCGGVCHGLRISGNTRTNLSIHSFVEATM